MNNTIETAGNDFLPLNGTDYIELYVGNVYWNQMNPWVSFYENVMVLKMLDFL
jgi:4-hydroxyphenylpyruvate dioxygenase-like putative hemolysin